MNKEKLLQKSLWVRQKILEMATSANSGHITSAFSQTELLVALYYGKIMNYDPKNPKWEDRDRFILSKGQGGIGFYPILSDLGYFSLSDLDNFCGKNSKLGVHAESHIPGMEILSGSLGHGLPISTGICQAAKLNNKNFIVFCLLGDCELFEGSNWEAAIYAGHKKLNNLVCIVDKNKQGVLGFTEPSERIASDPPAIYPLQDKFEAFGFETKTIDGHNFDEIFQSLENVHNRINDANKPLVIIANTKKGKGSSIMEDKRQWHYRVPTGKDLDVTKKELLIGD